MNDHARALTRVVVKRVCPHALLPPRDFLPGRSRAQSPSHNPIRRFLVLWCRHGESRRNYFALARPALDRAWDLNPIAYKHLVLVGGKVGILFVLLGAALTAGGLGWFRRRPWGWRLAVIIIAAQVLGDVFNCVTGDSVCGGAGIIIEGTLLLFLLQPRTRAAFT